jgi:hypothetical protein
MTEGEANERGRVIEEESIFLSRYIATSIYNSDIIKDCIVATSTALSPNH